MTRNVVEMKRITDDELIDDLIRVSRILGSTRITSPQYYEKGKYSYPTITERFGSWSKYVAKAGLDQTDYVKPITSDELFEELERIWILLEKQPTTTDMKKGISKYSLDTYMRRFGGWRNALVAFMEYINSDEAESFEQNNKEILSDINAIASNTNISQKEIVEKHKKRTTRNTNLKLRFRILQRDNFKCCFCGASPAKDPNIELHIDHIVPWSRGGETVISNLQTLCSKCNLGKSNLE